MTDIQIDEYSVVPLHLKVRYQKKSLGNATAFAYKHSGDLFLITNWHVVSGRDPITGQPLDKKTAAIPDSLRIQFHVEGKLGSWAPANIPLITKGNVSAWYQHPAHGQQVDVAAIPFECPAGLTVYPINEVAQTEQMLLSIGQDVFILGYPLNIRAGGVFPVWKRASVASEPNLSFEHMPAILVDTATYSGMSGSPVVAVQRGQYQSRDGDFHLTPGVSHRLVVGVYSGRVVGADGQVSQLGQVWRANLVEEIISGRKVGSYVLTSGGA